MSLKIDKVQLEIIINSDPARKKIRELEDEAKLLRKEMKKLPEDSEAWKKSFEKLKGVEGQLQKLRNEIGLNGMTIRELQQRYRELNQQMAHLDPRLPEWKQLQAEQKLVKARMAELTGQAQQTGFSMGKLANSFNKYFGIITAGVATLTGVIFSFRKTVQAFNDYEKAVDRLSALTGLTGYQLEWLSEQAKKMSTETIEGGVRITQGADMIVEAFTKVGSARPELLKDKNALQSVTQEAIILSQAAGTELQPAVEALTMVMNQFNTPASEARRIINVLAAGSKEGAGEIPYLSTAFEKAGTVASDAGISIEELAGIIETLAPRMTQPEIAGRSLKGVILDLQKTSDDTNPTIVGFTQAIENLAKKNLSTTELLKIFNSEHITTARILLKNVEETKRYTQALTGTSVAIEQASINTDNNASRLEQARNRVKLLSIELGERLSPALTFSTSSFGYLIRATMAVIRFFDEYKTVIVSTLAGITAYTIAVNASAIKTRLFAFATNIAEKAVRIFNTALKGNPIGLIVGLISAGITALLMFSRQLSATEKAQRMLNDVMSEAQKSIADEKIQLELLLNVAKDEKRSKEERESAIKKINALSPEYLGNLKLETLNTETAKQATDKYIESLLQRARIEAAREKLVKIEKELIDVQDNGTASAVTWWQSLKNAWTTEDAVDYQKKQQQTMIDNTQKAVDELVAKRELLMKYFNEMPSLSMGGGKTQPKEGDIEEIDGVWCTYKNGKWVPLTTPPPKGDKVKDKKGLLSDEEKDAWEGDREWLERTMNLVKAESEERRRELTDSITGAYEEEKLALQQEYLAQKIDKETFDQEMYILELSHLEAMKALKQRLGEDTTAIEEQLMEKRIGMMEKETAARQKQLSIEEQTARRKEELSKQQIKQAFMAGAAAVDQAKTMEEAGRAILNSIRDQIKAYLAEAVAEVVADQLIKVPFPVNLAAAAAAAGALTALFNSLVPQFAGGNYMDVTGAGDGKKYRARVTRHHRSGLFGEPTLVPGFGLFGETSEPELVFNPADTRKLMNTPGLIAAINHTIGARQFAQGNAREIIRETEKTFTDPALVDAIARLNRNLERGIEARLRADEDYILTHEEVMGKMTRLRQETSG